MSLDLYKFLDEVWREKPVVMVLCVGGFLIFVLLVIDTYRHRKVRKERHESKRLH